MPKSIPPEIIKKVLKLHREGNSYRRIGEACGLDQRTVKAAVQRETVRRGRDYWERVSSQADA
jgi:DNA-directed RNA polymerase specialized sigma24 family protein